ncbi:MAG: glycoside hydrolase family 88 protein [Lachnospiraceae bacterium]|nr:glycoside hydrolase family 88 protein [Lachnospiraceae bacterium]
MKEVIERIQKRTLELDMSECNWGEGVALWGFNRSVKAVPSARYLPFLKEWVKKGIAEERFKHTVNNSIPCIGLGEVYKAVGDEECFRIMKGQAEYLMKEAPRLNNGAIIHTDPYARFGRQMWADTIFMAGLFLAYMGRLTGNQAYIEEAMNQLAIHIDVLQAEDGLLYHGWDETLQEHIGCKWGRANAWVSVGIVEMLDYMPADERMIRALERQLDAIAPWQKENGLWRTVLNGTFSYLEASSAYGFGYAILKGVRLGVLDRKYLALVDRMKDTLYTNVDETGKVNNISAGTPVMRNEAEYNIICEHRIQTWGQGLALLYFSECQLWEEEGRN